MRWLPSKAMGVARLAIAVAIDIDIDIDIARICNAAMGAKARFHVPLHVGQHTSHCKAWWGVQFDTHALTEPHRGGYDPQSRQPLQKRVEVPTLPISFLRCLWAL